MRVSKYDHHTAGDKSVNTSTVLAPSQIGAAVLNQTATDAPLPFNSTGQFPYSNAGVHPNLVEQVEYQTTKPRV